MHKPRFRCLFCGKAFSKKDLQDRGFIRSRKESEGGPYFLYKCTHCREEMHCYRGEGGWTLSPREDAWSPFEFFRRILEGYSPLRPGGEKAGARDQKARRGARPSSSREKEEGARPRKEKPPLSRKDAPDRWHAFYQILGIDSSASREDVVTAFRTLSKKVHPDRFASYDKEFQRLANRKFIELKEAYDTLLKEKYS